MHFGSSLKNWAAEDGGVARAFAVTRYRLRARHAYTELPFDSLVALQSHLNTRKVATGYSTSPPPARTLSMTAASGMSPLTTGEATAPANNDELLVEASPSTRCDAA
ncbi:hypothetical protein I4F81_006026 [Pyropia yezoensis]|uniref:Uncharacterized protein n=1 Tax=Pyropia yezoensis TaxID=2788 RepID=A0ACC3C0J4_PYRYE|nr:hypothetical protein I4F81_006026 [Neopyropia yezoensis]